MGVAALRFAAAHHCHYIFAEVFLFFVKGSYIGFDWLFNGVYGVSAVFSGFSVVFTVCSLLLVVSDLFPGS